jgi:hypothetical protein
LKKQEFRERRRHASKKEICTISINERICKKWKNRLGEGIWHKNQKWVIDTKTRKDEVVWWGIFRTKYK